MNPDNMSNETWDEYAKKDEEEKECNCEYDRCICNEKIDIND